MVEGLLLLVGYVLGTLQVLSIDWVTRRRQHRNGLRALRAELQRLQTLRHKFDWGGEGPKDDSLPKPPTVSSAYTDLVVSTDFSMTDEFVGDNTQFVLLTILDGCEVIQDTFSQIKQRSDQLRVEADPHRKERLRGEMLQLASSYDEKLEALRYSVQSAISDLDRRLEVVRYHRQAAREFKRLPAGENPPPLGPNDPRLLRDAE